MSFRCKLILVSSIFSNPNINITWHAPAVTPIFAFSFAVLKIPHDYNHIYLYIALESVSEYAGNDIV